MQGTFIANRNSFLAESRRYFAYRLVNNTFTSLQPTSSRYLNVTDWISSSLFFLPIINIYDYTNRVSSSNQYRNRLVNMAVLLSNWIDEFNLRLYIELKKQCSFITRHSLHPVDDGFLIANYANRNKMVPKQYRERDKKSVTTCNCNLSNDGGSQMMVSKSKPARSHANKKALLRSYHSKYFTKKTHKTTPESASAS